MALCIHFKILTPLAVGYDAKNQDTVKSIFVSDLQDFREGKSVSFYHGGLKRNVIVYLDLLASLQDQPERCSANCIMLGTSKYTACWGLAMDIGAVASRVPSCASCLSLLTNGIINSNCSICVNWDLRRDSILLHFPSPMNYPPSMLSEHAMLKPLVITYDVLKHAVRAAHNGFVNNGWSSSNVKIYHWRSGTARGFLPQGCGFVSHPVDRLSTEPVCVGSRLHKPAVYTKKGLVDTVGGWKHGPAYSA
jgi:hypothetical protein